MSPFLINNEPTLSKSLFALTEIGGRLLREFFTHMINFSVSSMIGNNGKFLNFLKFLECFLVPNFSEQQAITQGGSIIEHYMEIQEDEDTMSIQEDVKPDITKIRIETNENNDLMISDTDTVEITRQIQRKSNRRRTTRAK